MSHQPSSLPPSQHQRQLHRRQNSTPVIAFEAMKVSSLPPTTQRQGVHRRNLSYDQHQRSPIRRQGTATAVSITNNNHGQILREAQQLRTARPGQQQPLSATLPVNTQCAPSFQHPHLDNNTYDDPLEAYLLKGQPMQFPPSPYHSYAMSPAMSPMQNNFPDMVRFDENTQHYFQTMHQSQDPNAFDRRMSQPDLRAQMRPQTPAEQLQTGNFAASLPSNPTLTIRSPVPPDTTMHSICSSPATANAILPTPASYPSYLLASAGLYATWPIPARHCRA
jgi:hypothetical protein